MLTTYYFTSHSSYRSAIAGVEEKPPFWLRWRVPLYRATQARYHTWIMRRFHRRFWATALQPSPFAAEIGS
jgi:hypothetical protein